MNTSLIFSPKPKRASIGPIRSPILLSYKMHEKPAQNENIVNELNFILTNSENSGIRVHEKTPVHVLKTSQRPFSRHICNPIASDDLFQELNSCGNP
ncbi:unnamed protein product [Blepharisma stoltei]|uniref:Uncharacterized protein n=1 Tax=Blepharisma stoltei TaxID=1481888 RepID=A0AAU9J420_9CILI|nr:unnamed protein product [Blepharisma stoltei]